ncbi:MAG: methylmalonyl Co-A mutase-associated GTPase MeaB [Bdellovibrionales bacterium]
MSDQFGARLKAASDGDQRALAQLLSWVEKQGAQALRYPELLKSARPAYRIGITGPPGAGKSTLVGGLIKELRKKNLRVAVLAVDPSSPFSHGAILGDRIRYNEHVLDDGVFIRSLGTRGSLGGLSAAAYLMLRVFDAVGFDVVLIETVGVGQTELEIMNVADSVVVVLVPESGDSVQAMKAGLLEIADIFVVNKADRPGAASMAKELQFIGEIGPENRPKPKVLMTNALSFEGVLDLSVELLGRLGDLNLIKLREQALRLRHEARALLRAEWENSIETKLKSLKKNSDLAKVLGAKTAPVKKKKRK